MPVTLVCPQCRFTLDVKPSEARFGVLCPDCHMRRMKPKRTRRPGDPSARTVAVRPAAVRLLVGAVLLGALGAALLSWSDGVMQGRGAQGRVGARFFAYGIVCCIGAVVCAVGGAGIIVRDALSEE